MWLMRHQQSKRKLSVPSLFHTASSAQMSPVLLSIFYEGLENTLFPAAQRPGQDQSQDTRGSALLEAEVRPTTGHHLVQPGPV